MSKMQRDMFGTYENYSATVRRNAAFRSWLCSILGYPFDSCCTTSELASDARRAGLYGWEA